MANSMHYCEVCRFELKERGYRGHAVSVFHKKAKLIRAMLERNCITHTEIAKRIGLSRERVRQLALRMGFANRKSRHAVCRMERRKKALPEFFVKAEERGFAVEPLGLTRDRAAVGYVRHTSARGNRNERVAVLLVLFP